MVLSAPGVGHDADDQKDMIVWIQTRIKLSNFNNISQLWNDEDHTCIVSEFLVDPSIKSLFATVDRCLDNKLILSCNAPPEPSPGRIDVAYFIRAQGSKLCLSNIDDVLLFGTFAMHQTASSVLNIMEKVFFPHIFYTTDWNESSRRELMGLYHRFMATLTESANEESGRTVLYLPFKTGMNSGYDEYTGQRSSDPSDGDTSVTNRNLVQQLEGIAIHWTRQIKGVLSSHERDISTDSEGPIEELRYWKSRAKDLSSISDQLQSAEVQHIVSILNDACSKYAQPVEALTNLIEMGLQEAENIVKFLSILQEPCERLSKLKPEEIPSLLPELMNCTRLIFSLSSNYNTYERISGLLRRISGEIIRQCSSHISLNELFYGEVNDIVTILTQCIKCGKEWKDLYNRTSVSVNNRIKQSHLKEDPKSASSWQRNDASIFAEIDAFLQRCEDLIDVCHGRTQFITLLCGSGTNEIPASEVTQKLLGGMDGPEIEQTLEALSVSFRTQIDRLHNLDYNILDARASQWHNDYNSFKAVLKVRC
jgi:dynein heavy chain